MPSVTYYGTFEGFSGSNGLTATLTGSAIPSNAVITGVSYSLRISANKYSSSEWWNLTQIAVGGYGGSPYATDDATMYGTDHTFAGNMNFSASDIGRFSNDTITVYAEAYTTHNTTSYLWEVSITVNYETYTACGAPTYCAVDKTLSTGNATLSWGGATDGVGNPITAYHIYYSDSADGTSWNEWAYYTGVGNVGSCAVSPPDTPGYYRRFMVYAIGAVEGYHSSGTVSSNTIRRDWTACGAPLTCSVSETLSTVDATLSWSGATAGYGNAVTGYEVQRCESTNGSNWGAWSHLTTTTASSLSVAPPATAGNYYKFRVRTLGAAGASYYSGWKESSNTIRRGHAPLDGFTDETLTAGETYIKAVHMQELQNRVATLRSFYRLSAYGFTPIVAGQTSLAGWTAHVVEIRKAIDEIGEQHEAWLTINENKPRADVILQLRRVILSI